MRTERDELASLMVRLKEAVQSEPCHVHTVSMEIKNRSALPWLNQQSSLEKFYWRDREGLYEIAAHGVATMEIRKHGETLHDFIKSIESRQSLYHKDLRFYGGVAFDDQQTVPEEWASFGFGCFFVPLIELRTNGGGTILYLHASGESLPSLEKSLIDVFSARVVEPGVPPPVSRHDDPHQDAWSKMIEAVLETVKGDQLDKVVLARRARYRFDDELDPMLLLDRLQGQTPTCFHFLFQPSDTTAFIGATPERLFSKVNQKISTEAIAGTRPRGSTDRIDHRLSTRLLNSEKDRHEHEFVRDQISGVLNSFCKNLQGDPAPGLLKLSRGQHLYTGFKGELKEGISTASILSALHPTPAVGGVPTDAALSLIRREETFSRGWYAAPIGWLGRDEAEFAVAIRSGLIHGSHLDLYSGAGIVEGSDPDEEWSEIENKISDFIHILTQA